MDVVIDLELFSRFTSLITYLSGAPIRVGFFKFNMEGLYRYVDKELTTYARPIFLKFQKELEVTGSFKNKKTELKKEGFDPNQVKEPLYVLLPKTEEYVPLTAEVYQGIQEGKYRF